MAERLIPFTSSQQEPETCIRDLCEQANTWLRSNDRAHVATFQLVSLGANVQAESIHHLGYALILRVDMFPPPPEEAHSAVSRPDETLP